MWQFVRRRDLDVAVVLAGGPAAIIVTIGTGHPFIAAGFGILGFAWAGVLWWLFSDSHRLCKSIMDTNEQLLAELGYPIDDDDPPQGRARP
jgi:hypothetical protein